MDLLKIIIFYTALCFCNNLHSKTKGLLYTLEDLKILKEQKNYFEFLNHALDIRPSKRDKSWEKMVQDMATGFISSTIEKKQISKDYFLFIEDLLSWPSLTSKLYVFRPVLTPAWDTDNKKNNSAEVTIVVVCNVSKPMHEIIASTPEI